MLSRFPRFFVSFVLLFHSIVVSMALQQHSGLAHEEFTDKLTYYENSTLKICFKNVETRQSEDRDSTETQSPAVRSMTIYQLKWCPRCHKSEMLSYFERQYTGTLGLCIHNPISKKLFKPYRHMNVGRLLL